MRTLKLCLASFIAIVATLIFVWWNSKSLDLSYSTSKTIKNSKGQPAELWWWRPRRPPGVVQYPKEFPKSNHAEDFADENGEMVDNWGTDWLTNKWHKVAKIIERPNGQIKVYLVKPPPPDRHQHREYVAYPSELTRERGLWPNY